MPSMGRMVMQLWKFGPEMTFYKNENRMFFGIGVVEATIIIHFNEVY
jgi:hypothetical protein